MKFLDCSMSSGGFRGGCDEFCEMDGKSDVCNSFTVRGRSAKETIR
jgi:hypothetical protein